MLYKIVFVIMLLLQNESGVRAKLACWWMCPFCWARKEFSTSTVADLAKLYNGVV